jgi:DNA-packaging protein gp3
MAGRPLKFKSVEELQRKIDEYFESCFEEVWEKTPEGWKPVTDHNGNIIKQQVKPFTITGLAHHLGTTRRTLLDYEQREDEFSHTIRKAKTRIEAYVEESLWKPKIATGVMFNLKNNFGWQDKQNLEHSGPEGGAIQFVSSTPDVVNEDEWNSDH